MGFVWALPIAPLVLRIRATADGAALVARARSAAAWITCALPAPFAGWAALAGTMLVVAAGAVRASGGRAHDRSCRQLARAGCRRCVAGAPDRGGRRVARDDRHARRAGGGGGDGRRPGGAGRRCPADSRAHAGRAGGAGRGGGGAGAAARRRPRPPAAAANRGPPRTPRSPPPCSRCSPSGCGTGCTRRRSSTTRCRTTCTCPRPGCTTARLTIVPAVFGDTSPAYAPAQPGAVVPVADGAAALRLPGGRRPAPAGGAGGDGDRRRRARGRRRARRRRSPRRWRSCWSRRCTAQIATAMVDLGWPRSCSRRCRSVRAARHRRPPPRRWASRSGRNTRAPRSPLPFAAARRRDRAAAAALAVRGRDALIALAVLVATGGFWYLRNIALTGNPLYPVAVPGLSLPARYGGAEMRAWDYHLPIGDVGALWRLLLGAGIAFASAAAIALARAWRGLGAGAGGGAGRRLLAGRSLSGEPLPVRARLVSPRWPWDAPPASRRRCSAGACWAWRSPAGCCSSRRRGRCRWCSRRWSRPPRTGCGSACRHTPAPAPPPSWPRPRSSRSRSPSVPGTAATRRGHVATPSATSWTALWAWMEAQRARQPRRVHGHERRLPAGRQAASTIASRTSTSRARRTIGCTTFRPRRARPPSRLGRRASRTPSRRATRDRARRRRPGWPICAPPARRCCSSPRCIQSSGARSTPTPTAFLSSAPGPTRARTVSASLRVPGGARLRHLACAPVTRACAVALLLFVAGRCLVPMDETDLFFNLRLGEIVLTEPRAAHQPAVVHLPRPPRRQPGLAVPDRCWRWPIARAASRRRCCSRPRSCSATWAVLYRVARPARRPPGGRGPGAGAGGLGGRAALRRAPAPGHLPGPGAPAARARARRGAAARARSTRCVPVRARLGQRQLLLLPGAGRARALRAGRALDERQRARRAAPLLCARRCWRR